MSFSVDAGPAEVVLARAVVVVRAASVVVVAEEGFRSISLASSIPDGDGICAAD